MEVLLLNRRLRPLLKVLVAVRKWPAAPQEWPLGLVARPGWGLEPAARLGWGLLVVHQGWQAVRRPHRLVLRRRKQLRLRVVPVEQMHRHWPRKHSI